jgi:hypothetical protein
MTWPTVVGHLVDGIFSWPVALMVGGTLVGKFLLALHDRATRPKSASEALFGVKAGRS